MADDTSKTATPAGGARPSTPVLEHPKEVLALYAAFMPHLTNGGLFIPTTRAYKLGDQVYMLLSLMDDPAKLPVAGTVVWVTPPGAHGSKQQGVGVQFSADESGQSARRKIENILGNAISSSRPTHTL